MMELDFRYTVCHESIRNYTQTTEAKADVPYNGTVTTGATESRNINKKRNKN